MNKRNKIVAGILSVLFLLPIFLSAQGWEIEESNGSVTKMSGDWIKVEETESDSYSSIYNVKDGILIIINSTEEQYAKGTVEDYCNSMKAMTNSLMEGMSPEEQKMMEQYMKQAGEAPAPTVTIKEMGSGGKIAGYDTKKVQVLTDNELFEEIWIAQSDELSELIKAYAQVSPFVKELAGCSSFEINLEQDPTFSEAYTELMLSGLEMKSIRHEYGTPNPGTSITRIEQKSISSSEFQLPAGFTKVDFSEFMMNYSNDDEYEEEYDYDEDYDYEEEED